MEFRDPVPGCDILGDSGGRQYLKKKYAASTVNWKLTGQSVSNYGRRLCAFRNLIIKRGSVEKTPHGDSCMLAVSGKLGWLILTCLVLFR